MALVRRNRRTGELASYLILSGPGVALQPAGISPRRGETLWSSGEWELDVQGCARTGRALHDNGAAERLDAVFQPDQAGAPGRIGPAGPVVTDAEATGAT